MTRPTAKSLPSQTADRDSTSGSSHAACRLMDGRVSEYAADRQVRSLECVLAARVGALPCGRDARLLRAGPGAGGVRVLAAAIIWIIAWSVAGYRYGRAACLDIVRAAGLPDHAWRKVRADTPRAVRRLADTRSAAPVAQP